MKIFSAREPGRTHPVITTDPSYADYLFARGWSIEIHDAKDDVKLSRWPTILYGIALIFLLSCVGTFIWRVFS